MMLARLPPKAQALSLTLAASGARRRSTSPSWPALRMPIAATGGIAANHASRRASDVTSLCAMSVPPGVLVASMPIASSRPTRMRAPGRGASFGEGEHGGDRVAAACKLGAMPRTAPLQGWYVISLRPLGRHGGVRAAAARHGARCVAVSTLRIEPLHDPRALTAALAASRGG